MLIHFFPFHVDLYINARDVSVPLPVSHEVLKELVGITTPPEQTKTPHAQLQLDVIPDHMFFALQLYYRWLVACVSFNKKNYCMVVEARWLNKLIIN